MADPALQRTIRRCAAVLAILLSLYPMVFVARLETDGYPYMNTTLRRADDLAFVILLGAILYLLGSVCLQVWQAQPETSGAESSVQTE